MDQIVYNSSIWDLHLHTCLSPKSSGDFQKMNVKEYIDYLVLTFKKYNLLKMISFTDHNKINWEVYDEFISRETGIVLIPGIELDTYIDDNPKNIKHIIFYFNIVDKNELKKFSEKVNNYIDDKNSIVKIDDFLNFVISSNIEFVLSPHVFKQDKRGLDFDWNSLEKTKSEPKKYMDQFFCFWETSGKSAIAMAKQFLNDYELDEKVSIISFSDSSNKKTLESYLQNPPQYFNCLPSFKGIQLAGTDFRRIVKEPFLINNASIGDFIYKIEIKGQTIELLPKLNAIIGGRGSGKSLLLDNIAINLDSKIEDDEYLLKERKDFLKEIDVSIYNFAGKKLSRNEIKLDYYNQSYVSKIFNESESSIVLKKYFSDEFEKINDIPKDEIILEINSTFLNSLRKITSLEKSNISGLVEKFIITKNDKFPFKYNKKDIVKIDKLSFLGKKEFYKNMLNNTKIIPKELKDNKIIRDRIDELYKIINNEIYVLNDINIKKNIKSYFVEAFIDYTTEKSTIEKDKKSIEEIFNDNIEMVQNKYLRRIFIINSYIELAKGFKNEYKEFNVINGFDNNKFLFEKKLIIEKPLQYLERVIKKYFDGTKIKGLRLIKLIDLFCYKIEDYLKDSKNYDDFIGELININLTCTETNKIYYSTDGEHYEDLFRLSPGTQTNILMEYIVSKETTIPLLIDQPEDNIDNETIYGKLTEWFNELKSKRQIIVVTHDANIVVNSDAENIIIAKKSGNSIFEYRYGALEYNTNLEEASIILDGGKEAVERRLKKYGE